MLAEAVALKPVAAVHAPLAPRVHALIFVAMANARSELLAPVAEAESNSTPPTVRLVAVPAPANVIVDWRRLGIRG